MSDPVRAWTLPSRTVDDLPILAAAVARALQRSGADQTNRAYRRCRRWHRRWRSDIYVSGDRANMDCTRCGIDQLEDRIEILERNWAELFGAPMEDEPATDEFPVVQPETEPMALVVDPTPAVQARRDAAWDEQRPSPVPRETEWTERTVNIGGTLQTYRIPAKREEAS